MKTRKDSKGRVLRQGESQRADGMYMYRYTDSSGKRRTLYSWRLVRTDKTPAGCRSVKPLRDLEDDVTRDKLSNLDTGDASRITCNELFDHLMASKRSVQETTKANYIFLYNKHVRDALGFAQIKSIRYSKIQQLYDKLLSEQLLKVSTVNTINSILYQMFDLAVKDKLVSSNPVSFSQSNFDIQEENLPIKKHALTKDEQGIFISYVRNSPMYCKWYPLVVTLVGSGLRIGEALALTKDDVDLNSGLLYITKTLSYKPDSTGKYSYRIGDPKTKASIRIVPIVAEVRNVLTEILSDTLSSFTLDGYTGFLFTNRAGKPYPPHAVRDAFQSIAAAYNADELVASRKEHREPVYLSPITPHNLRHTFCTRLCENMQDVHAVQDIMGHKNISTTTSVYDEIQNERRQKALQSIEGKIF